MKLARSLLCLIYITALSLVDVRAAEEFRELSRDEIQFKLLEIQIQRGDTLYKFASRYLNDPQRWPELLNYNKIPSGDPNLIIPGDTVKVPTELVKDEIADIYFIRNNVRIRREKSNEWKDAKLYMRLFPEEGIRTADNSFAKIKYIKGERASIGENALVFLRPEKKRDNVVKLEIGELTVKDVKVLTSSASIDPEKGSEYTAMVDKNKATRLSVLKGKVDFISSGEMVTVPEGFMSIAEFNKPPEKPIKLPPPPKFKTQNLDKKDVESSEKLKQTVAAKELNTDYFLNYLSNEAEEESAGGDKAAASSEKAGVLQNIPEDYKKDIKDKSKEKIHVQISQDSKFTRIVLDQIVDSKKKNSNWQENLPEGIYWWRVAYVNDLGIQGRYSSPVKLEVVDKESLINVEYPKPGARFNRSIVTVKGNCAPDMIVTVNGKLVKLDRDGVFITAVNLVDGQNTLHIKALDKENNLHEKSITVEALPLLKVKKSNILITAGIIASVVSMLGIMVSIIR